MKRVYLVGGTMGVGKTTACRRLKDMLSDSVLLDGDWCWDMHPFRVTDETKAMVMDNICHLLNSFLRCSTLQNVVFCWVMHRQEIIDEILSRLEGEFEPVCVSLICTPEALKRRLEKDVCAGLRDTGVIDRSMERLPLYDALNTVHLEVSELAPEEVARRIAELQARR